MRFKQFFDADARSERRIAKTAKKLGYRETPNSADPEPRTSAGASVQDSRLERPVGGG
jgi:hypothetical protein